MKIAFLGDSITLGYALEDRKDRYATVLCEKLGVQEINLGITGTLVAKAGLNSSDGKSFLDRLPEIGGADIAVIFGGTNDYFWSDRPIFPPDGNDTEEYFHNALTAMCRQCKKDYPEIKVVLVTPYPHRGIGNYKGGAHWKDSSEHDTSERNFNGHVLSDYVNDIVAIGAEFDIPTLNLHKNFTFDHRLHTSDGCHPNPEGHRLLAEKIGAFLSTCAIVGE